MIVPMNSQHADPTGLTVRPPIEDLTAARAVLGREEIQMKAFITACLRALHADPAAMLAFLKPHWPAARKFGRPRKDDSK